MGVGGATRVAPLLSWSSAGVSRMATRGHYCFRHVASVVFVSCHVLSPVYCLSPPILSPHYCFSGSTCVSLISLLVCLPINSRGVCCPVLILCFMSCVCYVCLYCSSLPACFSPSEWFLLVMAKWSILNQWSFKTNCIGTIFIQSFLMLGSERMQCKDCVFRQLGTVHHLVFGGIFIIWFLSRHAFVSH